MISFLFNLVGITIYSLERWASGIIRADLHGTIFVSCDKLTTGLRHDLRLVCTSEKCRSILKHVLKRCGNRTSCRRSVVGLSHATKIVPCKLALTLSFGRLRQRIVLKYVPHNYFSSFIQSDHCFLTLSLPLPSSFLKLWSSHLFNTAATTLDWNAWIALSRQRDCLLCWLHCIISNNRKMVKPTASLTRSRFTWKTWFATFFRSISTSAFSAREMQLEKNVALS